MVFLYYLLRDVHNTVTPVCLDSQLKYRFKAKIRHEVHNKFHDKQNTTSTEVFKQNIFQLRTMRLAFSLTHSHWQTITDNRDSVLGLIHKFLH